MRIIILALICSHYCFAQVAATGQGPSHDDIVKFAPLVLYKEHDKTWPSNIDWYLARASLWCFDKKHSRTACLASGSLASKQCGNLLDQSHMFQSGTSCGFPAFNSENFRDKDRRLGFMLKGDNPEVRIGTKDASQWITYYSVHPTDYSGWVISYWRFYSYNNGWHGIGDHEGDWEATEVILNSQMVPTALAVLGHRKINEVAWTNLSFRGTHPIIFADPVGHTSRSHIPKTIDRCVQHETWGRIIWPDGRTIDSGGLAPLGTRFEPAQRALGYSGLWGRIGNRLLHNFGYWGPAFNETSEKATGFITAWCYHWTSGLASECFSPSRERQK